MRTFLRAGACLLALACAGCGYTTRSAISNQYRTIYIVPFVNKIDITLESNVQGKYKIYRPRLETDITKAVANKYLFDGNLRPVSEANADLVLRGELVEFMRDPLRYDDNDEVEEYRVNVRVNLALWDARENKLVWEEKSFTGDTTYFTPGHLNSKSDEAAISDAIADLARRIVERTVEEW
jgi:hypothetical protein